MAEARQPVLSVRDLRVHFRVRGGAWPWSRSRMLQAVRGVGFEVHAGETLGIVGESGCGKSTLARALLNLVPAASGDIVWLGQPMRGAPPAAWMPVRRHAQMVFQDPLAALNPRMTIGDIVGEPLRTHQPTLGAAERAARVQRMLERVGLRPDHAWRYPHEFSGGQCQRVGIARALILEPKLVICDEPVSALDVSIQAQIVNLLQDLQRELGLALIVIAHDLAVVRQLSHRVAVMYLGEVVELADRATLYGQPRHPYTSTLLAAVPVPDPVRERHKVLDMLLGDQPSPVDLPAGCAFRSRCPCAFERCAAEHPPLMPAGGPDAAALVRCWLVAEAGAGDAADADTAGAAAVAVAVR